MKRHPFDPFSLVFGLTFAGLGALLLDTDVDVAGLASAGWLPFPVVFLGLLLLAVGLTRVVSGERAEPGPEQSEHPDESGI